MSFLGISPSTLKKVTLRVVFQVCCVLFVSGMALNNEIVLAHGLKAMYLSAEDLLQRHKTVKDA